MNEIDDEGGDPACWAHLFGGGDLTVADLSGLMTATGDGVHWTLDPAGDLNANLVRLDAGHEMGAHMNDEVDVLLVILAGRGHVTVDASSVALAPNTVASIPKGTTRSIQAGPDGLTYVTVHRRRDGPTIARRQR